MNHPSDRAVNQSTGAAGATAQNWIEQHQRKDLLRLLTCGSVDDGKSTLIGRLLHDTKLIYEDQLAAAERDSVKYGTTGQGKVDLALLCDGLKAEREQGITIDVAYRYFSTERRGFIIADCPGHEQYTRNMATGASTCDLAVVLIDARYGVLEQTKRHSFIVSLMGIRHVVVAVNKMDLVDFDRAIFERIVGDFEDFAARLDLPDLHFIPLSALDGDNVVDKSERTPWFEASPLLPYLETVHISSDRNLVDLRFPVQHVIRPSLDFRGFAGTVAAGVVRRGDEVVVLPQDTTSRVERICTFDGDLEEAPAGRAVTLVLADEIDCSRGDLICHPGNRPTLARELDVMAVWMDAEPFAPERHFWLRGSCGYVVARVTEVRYRIDVNTLHRRDGDGLELNQIARLRLETTRPVPVDPYAREPVGGSFVLVDRTSHAVAAACMVREAVPVVGPGTRPDHAAADSRVSAEERATLLGQHGRVLWISGPPASGKSELAVALERACVDRGHPCIVLDGSAVRAGLSSDLGFSTPDREEQARRLAEVARLCADAGLLVIVASHSPIAAAREHARGIVGGERFAEVTTSGTGDATGAGDDEYEAPVAPLLRFERGKPGGAAGAVDWLTG